MGTAQLRFMADGGRPRLHLQSLSRVSSSSVAVLRGLNGHMVTLGTLVKVGA